MVVKTYMHAPTQDQQDLQPNQKNNQILMKYRLQGYMGKTGFGLVIFHVFSGLEQKVKLQKAVVALRVSLGDARV